jgi:hypothetical protein
MLSYSVVNVQCIVWLCMYTVQQLHEQCDLPLSLLLVVLTQSSTGSTEPACIHSLHPPCIHTR